jgi:hypothetical protein
MSANSIFFLLCPAPDPFIKEIVLHFKQFIVNKDVIKKIRIWARVFGTGPGPGLPLLLTTIIHI